MAGCATAALTTGPHTLTVSPSITAQAEGVTGYNFYRVSGTNSALIASNAAVTIPVQDMKFGDVYAASSLAGGTNESNAIFCTNSLPSTPISVGTK